MMLPFIIGMGVMGAALFAVFGALALLAYQTAGLDSSLVISELARLASAKAVRLPAVVSEPEMRALLAQLLATRAPLTSPAGKPTYIELHHGELARRFQK